MVEFLIALVLVGGTLLVTHWVLAGGWGRQLGPVFRVGGENWLLPGLPRDQRWVLSNVVGFIRLELQERRGLRWKTTARLLDYPASVARRGPDAMANELLRRQRRDRRG